LLDDRTVQGPHVRGSAAPVPYLPGASLKGRLRHHARQLSHALGGWDNEARSEAEGALFGFADRPGGLVYADLHLDHEQNDELLTKEGAALLPYIARTERSFVSLSRERRVALSGRLFRLELAERGMLYGGVITGYLPVESAERDLGLLLAALRELSHLGGHKGRGMGKCNATISAVTLGDAPREWADLVGRLPCTS
jgi:CRISPR/Cas system CSM-associated protein Csm3 (group 7 of RAMP superfamily)